MISTPSYSYEVSISDISKDLANTKVTSIGSSGSVSSASISLKDYPLQMADKTVEALSSFRNKVPYLADGSRVFLNCSSQIPLNNIVTNSIEDFFAGRSQSPDPEFVVFDGLVEHARALYSQLIGCREVCFTRDSCESLFNVQNSIAFCKGDAVVILDNEFQHNGLSWLGFIRNHPELELELRVVDTGCDKTYVANADNIGPYMDEKVRVISLSRTMYQSGLRNDIESITSGYPEVHTIVDLTQDVGFCPVDVEAMGCSAGFFSTFKGLFVPQGLGILYMSQRLLDDCKPIPPFVNIKGLKNFNPNDLAVTGEFDLHANLHRGVLKFEHCNKPNLQIAASVAMLEFFASLGMANVAEYLSFLRTKLVAVLEKYNIEVITAQGFESPNIVVCKIDNLQWMKHFRENNVIVSQFRNIVRFSIGIYNNVEDLNKLEQVLKAGQGIAYQV